MIYLEIENIDSKIPKSADSIKKTLDDCIRRKRIQTFSKEDAKTFLSKAYYHLQCAESFEADNFSDWAIIAYYAAMYMAAKAFTAYFLGKAAKDHLCTIALMLETIHGKKFVKVFGKTYKKFEEEIELLAKVRQYRNSMLYSVTEIKEKEIQSIGKKAFKFVEKINELVR